MTSDEIRPRSEEREMAFDLAQTMIRLYGKGAPAEVERVIEMLQRLRSGAIDKLWEDVAKAVRILLASASAPNIACERSAA